MPSGSSDGTAVIRTTRGYLVAAPRLIGELSMLGWQRGDIRLEFHGHSVALGAALDDFERFSLRLR